MVQSHFNITMSSSLPSKQSNLQPTSPDLAIDTAEPRYILSFTRMVFDVRHLIFDSNFFPFSLYENCKLTRASNFLPIKASLKGSRFVVIFFDNGMSAHVAWYTPILSFTTYT